MRIVLSIMIIAWMAGFTSCRTPASISETRVARDTVYFHSETKTRDTVIIAPASQVDVSMQVEAILNKSLKGFEKQFKNATLRIDRFEDSLRIVCECDTLAIQAQLRDKYEREYRQSEITITREIPVRYVPKWVRIFAWIGGISVAATGAYIFYKLKF